MKSKKTLLLSALGIALLVAAVSVVTAAADPVPPPPADPHAGLRAQVGEKLWLSADQQTKLDALRGQQRAELEALKANKDLSREQRREKAMAVLENYRGQMRAVLTPEQQEKMGAIRGMIGEKMAQRAHGAQRFHQARGDRQGAGRGQAMPPQRQPNPMQIVAMGERIKDHMAEQLGLTDEQRDKLDHLGREFRTQQRALAKKHMEDMRAVLTPEQQQKAQELKQRSPRGGRPQHPRVGLNDEPEEMMVADNDFDSDDMPPGN